MTTFALRANDLYRQVAEVAVLTVSGHLVSPAVVGLVHPRAGLAGRAEAFRQADVVIAEYGLS